MKTDTIVLVGYRGAGKSSTGEALARMLDKELVSTDRLVEEKVSMVITEYIQRHDWKTFRDCEHESLASLDKENIVLDCGGGIIEREDNRALLREKGIVFLLMASVETLTARLADSRDRPALTEDGTHLSEIQEVLKKRRPLYEEVADYILPTDGKSPERVAEDIRTLLGTGAHERIVIAVGEESVAATLQSMREAKKCARLVELRLDMIQDIDERGLRTLLAESGKDVIVTCRSKKEGGKHDVPLERRFSLLKTALSMGVSYVDIELSSGKEHIRALLKEREHTEIICSFHDLLGMPEDLGDVYSRLRETGADILKISCMGTTTQDNERMYALLRKAREEDVRLCGIVMGKSGEESRILGPAKGSAFTFAALREGRESAPGQLDVASLRRKMAERLCGE